MNYRLSVKGKVPEGDWMKYTIVVTVKWIDQKIIEMYFQYLSQSDKNLMLFGTQSFTSFYSIPLFFKVF